LGRKTVLQQALSDSEKVAVMHLLVDIGRETIDRRAELVFPWMPPLKDPEFLARNVLLWSIMNRGAKVGTVNNALQGIYAEIGQKVYEEPGLLFENFAQLSEKLSNLGYRIRYGGIQVRLDEVLLARFGSFAFFIRRLNGKHRALLDFLSGFNSPIGCEKELVRERFLGTMTPKAVRLFLGFVGHQLIARRLGIVADAWPKWNLLHFKLPTDGHLGKVFARTGLLDKVRAEDNKIVAFEMDRAINALVENYATSIKDPFLVNIGAYSIGQFCCKDEKSACELEICPSAKCAYSQICSGNCPIQNIGCKRYTHWWAMKRRQD